MTCETDVKQRNEKGQRIKKVKMEEILREMEKGEKVKLRGKEDEGMDSKEWNGNYGRWRAEGKSGTVARGMESYRKEFNVRETQKEGTGSKLMERKWNG